MPESERSSVLVGLQVDDGAAYAEYRAQMLPILVSYGGGFACDFTVSDVLLAPTDKPINRVFVIHFPSSDAKARFFNDPAYQEIKRRFFEPAVSATSILAEFTTSS